MKIPVLLLTLGISTLAFAQKNIKGAWQRKDETGTTHLLIIGDRHFSQSTFNPEAFSATFGGSWKQKGDRVQGVLEFHSAKAKEVGNKVSLLVEDDWQRVDKGNGGMLAGAWLITGRKREGQIRERKPGPRKTMKILSGTKFQWIAYNVETGEFFGTGGGTYTTIEGKYTENIEFFSRDQSRVGASLVFNFALKEGQWHHSGKSSKGSDIYEIWTLRTELDQ